MNIKVMIGDKFKVLIAHEGFKSYMKCKVEQIFNKKYYNMYLCKSTKGVYITFNDFDLAESIGRQYKDKKGNILIPKVIKGW